MSFRIVQDIGDRHIKVLADGFRTHIEAEEYLNDYYNVSVPGISSANLRIESEQLESESC